VIRFFSILKASLAKLAFWSKPRAVAPAEPDTPPPLAAWESAAAKNESGEAPAAPEPTPSRFTRLKHWLRLRRAPDSAEPVDPRPTRIIEKPARERLTRDADETGDESTLTPKPSWLTQLKSRLRVGRKPDAAEDTAAEQAQGIEKQADSAKFRKKSGTDPEQGAEEALPPQAKRFKRFLLRLRSKWVWIPATSITLLALITGVVLSMAQSAQEREKLKAELQTAKKKLDQKTAASVAAAKMALPIQTAAAAPEAKQTYLVLEAGGAARAETNSGIDAGDCVVKDKDSVVQNLKNCIEGFNSAMANSPEKTKKR